MYSRVASSFNCCCDIPAFSKISFSSASFLLVFQPTWAKCMKSVGVEISALVSFRVNFFLSRRCSNANVLTGAAGSGCPVAIRILNEIHEVCTFQQFPQPKWLFHNIRYVLVGNCIGGAAVVLYPLSLRVGENFLLLRRRFDRFETVVVVVLKKTFASASDAKFSATMHSYRYRNKIHSMSTHVFGWTCTLHHTHMIKKTHTWPSNVIRNSRGLLINIESYISSSHIKSLLDRQYTRMKYDFLALSRTKQAAPLERFIHAECAGPSVVNSWTTAVLIV